jgi:hypothetical protein
MPILEKVSQDDLILYEIMRNPVLFGEFIYNVDKLESEDSFKLDIYQQEFLCDFSSYVSFMAARAVGKTVSLSIELIWLMVMNIFPEDYLVYSVPNKVHLEPVFANLTRLFRSNSLLKHFIEPKGGINGSEFSIKLLNQSKLICRIAGQSGTGANVIGLHSPFVIVDEAGYYPWGTWVELQPTLNTWQLGFRLSVAGVPTGLRENNVLYHVDEENTNYSKHRVTAYQNPRWGEEDKNRAIEQYGGEDSDDYVHLVLGQHGRPIFALFDRGTFDIQVYPIWKLEIDGIRLSDNLIEVISRLGTIPGLPNKKNVCLMGIDLGYTEPTAIWINYIDDFGRMKFHAKIKLTKVSYPLQEKIIDMLDTKFEPVVIGIDKGSAGISVIQNLIEHKDWTHKNYQNKIIPIDFSSSMVLGIDKDGTEIKQKTKPFTVSVLQDFTINKRLIFSSTDMEMITELERMTYSKTPSGEIVYKTLTIKGGKKGEDHFTSALLCGVSAYYLTNEFSFLKRDKVRLISPQWV